MVPTDFRMFRWLRENFNVKHFQLSLSGMPAPDFGSYRLDTSFNEYLDSGINGSDLFRETLAKKFSVRAENVIPTVGATEAIFLGISALKPADVYLNAPEYEPFFRVAEVAGKHIRLADLRKSCPDDAASSAVAFSNPNNPTGSILKPSGFEKYEEAFVDETFIEFTGVRSSFRLTDNIAIAGTLSKFYGSSFTRAGWIIAKGEMMDRISTMKDLTSNSNPGFMLYIASKILDREEEIRKRNARTIGENRKLVEEFLLENSLKCEITDGVPFCFPSYGFRVSSDELCSRAIKEAGVLLVPGSIFGKEGHFRLCFTTDRDTLASGLDALSKFLKSVSAGS